ENSLTRQVEFESTEEELAKADQGHAEAEAAVTELEGEEEVSAQLRSAEVAQRSRERERKRLEELQAKAAQRSEASRESVLQALQAFIEAGLWFSDSFQKTQSRPVKMEQVKSAQAAVKAAIKPLTSHWQAVRKAREAQGKASNQRRKVTQKLSAAIASKVDAELQATASEKEHLEATEEEAQLRAERGARESELGATEGAKAAVELEDADMKRRRDELKAAQPRAKEDLKIARLAEKEALNERQALHTQCSRREKEQMQLEEAKNTAVSTLKAEEYKTGQVSEAYDQRWTKKLRRQPALRLMQTAEDAASVSAATSYSSSCHLPLIGSALESSCVDELAEELIRTVGTAQAQFHEDRNSILLEFEAARIQLHTEYSHRLLQADQELRSVLEERAARREPCGASQNDVLTLNVGGKLYTLKRETLLVCRGSFLAELFSGKWEHALQKDADGNPFLDIDPSIWDLILSWLRDRKIEAADRPAAQPAVPKEDLQHFQAAVDYLGLRPYLSVPGLSPDGWAASCGSTVPGGSEETTTIMEADEKESSRGFLKVAGSIFSAFRGSSSSSAPPPAPSAAPPSAAAAGREAEGGSAEDRPAADRQGSEPHVGPEEAPAPKRIIGWSQKCSHPDARRGVGECIHVLSIASTRPKACAAAARSTRGYQSGVHYFEVKVLSVSDHSYVGLAAAEWTSTSQPVGRASHSWGIASSGVVFAGNRELTRLPVIYGSGSTIGLRLELDGGQRTATAYIDGRCFENIFEDLAVAAEVGNISVKVHSSLQKYPAVSNMRAPAQYSLDCDAPPPEPEDQADADPVDQEPQDFLSAAGLAVEAS
ncbi:unnamed protein product, partial [Polarella glacialis]